MRLLMKLNNKKPHLFQLGKKCHERVPGHWVNMQLLFTGLSIDAAAYRR